MTPHDRIAVSSWSLHRLLGTTYPHDLSSHEVGPEEASYGEGTESLLGLPSALARHGIGRLELVSFHLRSRDPIYLEELRASLAASKVRLQTLLIDAGDLTDPVHGERDRNWIAGWIEVANALGAEHARIIAGKQKPTMAALDRSVAALRLLAEGNRGSSVRLVIENWFDLLPTPQQVHFVLDQLDGRIGLLADTGNWQGPSKYEDLRSICGRAELCHAKAQFNNGLLDEVDFAACIEAAESAGYTGPYTLIFDSAMPGEWDGIRHERDFVLGRIGRGASGAA